jgi:hypothetical protein
MVRSGWRNTNSSTMTEELNPHSPWADDAQMSDPFSSTGGYSDIKPMEGQWQFIRPSDGPQSAKYPSNPADTSTWGNLPTEQQDMTKNSPQMAEVEMENEGEDADEHFVDAMDRMSSVDASGDRMAIDAAFTGWSSPPDSTFQPQTHLMVSTISHENSVGNVYGIIGRGKSNRQGSSIS